MALIFMLAADCNTKEQAEAFAQHFEGTIFALSDGFTSQLSCDVFEQGNTYWVRVMPSGCGTSGVTPELVDRFNELATRLYTQLQTAPQYRTALVAVEAESYRNYDELLEDGIEIELPGLVVSEHVWYELGKPTQFVNYIPGYKWIPFEPFALRGPR